MRKGKTGIKSRLLIVFVIIFFVPIAWVSIVRFEGEKPLMETHGPMKTLNAAQKLTFTASDMKSGLRKIRIALIKDGKEIILYAKEFASTGLLLTGLVNKQTFFIKDIEPKKIGLRDGKAILQISVTDYSWRNWLRGNITYLEKEVVIDTKPPIIDIFTKMHNITQGGSGLVVYKISEPCSKTGVYVGDVFFPGYSGYFKDPDILLSFFALDYGEKGRSKIFVQAVDESGNVSKAGFYYYIKNRKFKADVINISDGFLNYKIPELESEISSIVDTNKKSMLDQFLLINRHLREANFKKISELVSNTDNVLYWQKKFLRLPKAAEKAAFADTRTYKYKGKVIDHQTHLGIDLASVAHASVPAANKGKVKFADFLGIYGKTVLIDHGFGLFSMYSHLSNIDVNEGQVVLKGDQIGHTGKTGLAGGDHLHFSMLVNKTFVNPLEWWDDNWIKNNITLKLDSVRSRLKN